MFLTYAHDAGRTLIHIAQAHPGQGGGYQCPFCGGSLAARKGEIVGQPPLTKEDRW